MRCGSGFEMLARGPRVVLRKRGKAGARTHLVQGWYRTVRLANACGAIVVTQHGCANFTPTLAEVEAFVASQGGRQ